MVLHKQSIKPIPPLTKQIAHQVFPQGNLYMSLRDELGTFYNDSDFAELYSVEGQPALHPGCLALVCVMQYMANLSDRGAAEAVAARIDWKYALGLELTDPGFDFSVLSLFRSRLLSGGKEQILLDKLLERCQELKLIKAKGKARTDSTHILAAIRNLNRLECVGETLRAALNALAVVAPDWLSDLVEGDWFDRYSKPVEESRLPRGTEARNEYAETIGRDGMKILEAIYDEPNTPLWLQKIPVIENLRRTWIHQYWVKDGQLHWRSHKDLPPAGLRSNSPYDTEARYGNKRHTTWMGYKVHLTETCDKNVKRRKQQGSKKWLKQYNARAGVEGTISQGVRGFGLRECRYIGLDKVHLQHILTATAINAIRLGAWFEGVPLAKTRISSFAKLAPD